MVKPSIYLLAIALLIAASVMADAPPAPPQGSYQAGWGMCPVNWENRFSPFQAEGTWRPGHDWVVGYEGQNNQTPVYIQYDPICLDLWIELYCMQTYEFTQYQWHRLGDHQEEVTFYICGTVSSNNPEWVNLVKEEQDLDRLHFMADVFGRDNGEDDIMIRWHYAWGSYNRPGGETPPDPRTLGNDCWTAISPGQNGNLSFQINEVSDHWFCWRGVFNIAPYQADGHYQLHMAGCPSPGL